MRPNLTRLEGANIVAFLVALLVGALIALLTSCSKKKATPADRPQTAVIYADTNLVRLQHQDNQATIDVFIAKQKLTHHRKNYDETLFEVQKHRIVLPDADSLLRQHQRQRSGDQ